MRSWGRSVAGRRVAGVYMDDRGVAVAEVRQGRSVPSVTKWAWAPLQAATPENRAEALRRLFVEHDFARRAVGCLPQNVALLRKVELPSGSPSETAAMATLRARQILPYSAEGVEVSFQSLEERAGLSRGVLHLFHRRAMGEFFSAAGAAGVALEGVVPEAQALLACCGTAAVAETACLIFAAAQRAAFAFFERGQVVFVRVLDGVDTETGSAFGMDGVLTAWRRLSPGVGPTATIVLSGDAAAWPQLREAIRRETGAAVVDCDPASILSRFGGSQGSGSRYEVLLAIGAALSADGAFPPLLPGEERLRRENLRRRWEWGRALAAGLLFSLSLTAAGFRKTHDRRRHLRLLEERLAAMGPEVHDTENMLEQIVRARARSGSRGSVSSVLSQAGRLLPPGVVLNTFDYKEDEGVSIQATARRLSSATAYVEALSRSDAQRPAALRSFSTREEGGQSVVDFQVGIDFSNGEMKPPAEKHAHPS